MEGAVCVLFRLVDRRFAGGLVSLAVLVVLCAAASPALASFPGRNGEIAYAWTNAQKYEASRTSIRAVNPRSRRVRVLRDCPVRSHPVAGYTDCNVSVPRYSPDGLRIAFPTVQTVPNSSGQPWQYQPSLGMMASDGTGLEERATTLGYYQLAWSPAGDKFLLVRAAGNAQPSAIFLASLDGTELTQVTPEWTQAPDWSTTGEIAFNRADPACPFLCEDIWGDTRRRHAAPTDIPRRVRPLMVSAWDQARVHPLGPEKRPS
jgi:hypothetical protein